MLQNIVRRMAKERMAPGGPHRHCFQRYVGSPASNSRFDTRRGV